MSRPLRVSLAFAVGAFAALLACAPHEEPRGEERPAPPVKAATPPPRLIVLVTVDTLRSDRVGFSGYRLPTTPFLDSLAAGGAVFERAYATSSWTPPTMASLFTGAAPMTHGVVSGEIAEGRAVRQPVLPESLETIAELLSRYGYRTLGVTSNRHLTRDLGFAQGFDRFFDTDTFPAAPVVHNRMRRLLQEELGETWPRTLREGRFFLWLHFFDPHDPYQPDPEWFEAHAPGIPLRGRSSPGRKVMKELRRLFPRPDAALAERIRPYYDSEIRRVDDELAAFWNEAGVGDDTLVAFTADHGEEMAEHGGLGHSQSLYEELVRIPLFLWWPAGIPSGTRIGSTVSALDLLPTLAEIVGDAPRDAWPGRSLLALARGAAGPDVADRPAFLELAPPKRFRWAVVEGDTKLIVDPAQGGRAELYDLSRDPGETTNLAAGRANDVERMRQALRERARRLPRAPDQGTRDVVDEKLQKELEALGYLGGEVEPASPPSPPR